ncbi:carboxymethylenebutenolidase [Actinomadura pelletieri DSM 43383]|uniref:Carboxymethylenebutenolidase n=1 Tax=Actinomadura pelletieri DSM 43383 TaxID=1120940 RepID=A0A495QYR8_9ACTN|nr:dienelactone hydrolase family protein [Actinomadura pelletieri]RKS79293.1 carboxymethylenebutenolidase [Actinomadura pelletieri DSM 43383]
MPSETLRILTADGQADAFVAFPDDGRPHPGVLLYTDAFGLRPELEGKARELAEYGYYVLVPNIFYRHGPAPVVELPEHLGDDVRPALIAQIMPWIKEHTPERILRDADAYLRFLATRPEVGAGPVAVVGYCVGAVLALRTGAAHPEQVAAVAGFHPGALVTDAPDSPHRLATTLTAQVHLGLAEGDLSSDAISELNRSLDAAGVDYTIDTYSGTRHGFTMSDTDVFDPSGHRRHWEELLQLLNRTLPNI